MAVPVQNIANAAAAYAKAPTANTQGLDARDTGQNSPFANLVKGAIEEAINIGHRGEAASIAAINDKADMNQVVTAVAEAEVTLQAVVNIRDKVIDSYKEILRMPV